MAADLSPEDVNPEIIAHLIHGTWPFGFLRRKPAKGCQPWFLKDSQFSNNIRRHLGNASILFLPFEWTGQNSVRHRLNAAAQLANCLSTSFQKYPSSKHFLIAHSHGGTVAAHAVAELGTNPSVRLIRSLICMATPFAFVVPASERERLLFCFCLGVLVVLPCLLGYMHFHVIHRHPYLSQALAFLILSLFTGTLAHLASRLKVSYARFNSNLRVVLIRRTRDEASLVLGLAQVITWLLAVPIRLAVSVSSIWAFIAWEIGLSVWLLNHPAELKALRAWLHITVDQLIPVEACLCIMVQAALYIFGYAVLAASVGYFQFMRWPMSSVEVDAGIPQQDCSLITLASEPLRHELRHGLHADQAVQYTIAAILSSYLK